MKLEKRRKTVALIVLCLILYLYNHNIYVKATAVHMRCCFMSSFARFHGGARVGEHCSKIHKNIVGMMVRKESKD